MAKNINNKSKNTEGVVINSKEVDLEVSAKHLFMSYYHDAGQNHTTKIDNKLF
jgi:hypothetical protein